MRFYISVACKSECGGGRFICLKVLLFLNDGQNLLIIFMALAAEGVNLVMKDKRIKYDWLCHLATFFSDL